MQVILAESYGMCFGVRDAVKMALDSPDRHDLTVLGELVHNPVVLEKLRGSGIRMVGGLDAPVETRQVMITAHGAADSVKERLRSEGRTVLEATCPLVTHAHRMLDRLVRQGYFPVVIGRSGHVEVRGLVQDLDAYEVVSGPEEIHMLAGRPRLGVVSQTTQPLAFVLEMVDRIRAAFPEAEVKFADTVCQPTKDRQTAARRLASACEVVIVVGGRASNNTRQLVHTCEAEGARAYQVEHADDLLPEWFLGIETVGLTAGTSTPDETIHAVRDAIEVIGNRSRMSRHHLTLA